MDDLKKLLEGYPEPKKPSDFTESVLKRIKKDEARRNNPLLMPGLACISCGILLSLMLKTGFTETAIEWIKQLGRFTQ